MNELDKNAVRLMKPEYRDHDPTYEAKEAWYLSADQLATFRQCPASYRRQQRQGFAGSCGDVLRQALRSQLGICRPSVPVRLPRGESLAVLRMHESVTAHQVARSLLAGAKAGPILRANLGPLPSQTRLDWLVGAERLVRLVTPPTLARFEHWAWLHHEIHAAAFQRRLVQEVLNGSPVCTLLAVEAQEPYRTGLWEISSETLALAERDNEDAIDRLVAFQTYDLWPTGYEQVRMLAVH